MMFFFYMYPRPNKKKIKMEMMMEGKRREREKNKIRQLNSFVFFLHPAHLHPLGNIIRRKIKRTVERD